MPMALKGLTDKMKKQTLCYNGDRLVVTKHRAATKVQPIKRPDRATLPCLKTKSTTYCGEFIKLAS